MKIHAQDRLAASKREEIVRHAYEVFYRGGFHAVGIDRLMEDSGISKRTLYKYFTSKEDLIKATLEHYHSVAHQSISEFMEPRPSGKRGDRVVGIFDFLESAVQANGAKGCFAMNAKSEFANRNSDIESICELHLSAVEKRIESYLREDGFPNSSVLALQISMLFQGAVFQSQWKKSVEPVRVAKDAVKILLLHELAQKPRHL